MEQKKGGRGIRVKSRRGSTTASHASLSAIPENVPLHPRSERSDSMRVAHAGQPLNRLADVQELEVQILVIDSICTFASTTMIRVFAFTLQLVLFTDTCKQQPRHVRLFHELQMVAQCRRR